MNCQRVQSRLSEFLDEILEDDKSLQVSEHLNLCPSCKNEFRRLTMLRKKLSSLGTVETPDFLQHLLKLRMVQEKDNTLRARLRDVLEYRWSVIRSTERMWYLTRILGTVMTSVFFLMIIASMSPGYLDQNSDGGPLPPAYRQQLGISVQKALGLTPIEAQRRPISPSEPRFNDLYLLNYSQSMPHSGGDDTFSVVMEIDRNGAAKIQNVLQYPEDKALLNNFNTMFMNARSRPASLNGRAVDSHLVLTFSKVSVYD